MFISILGFFPRAERWRTKRENPMLKRSYVFYWQNSTVVLQINNVRPYINTTKHINPDLIPV